MSIISIGEIVEVNRLFQEKGMPVRLHLRDACGGQALWLERPEDTENSVVEEAFALLRERFGKQAQKIRVEKS